MKLFLLGVVLCCACTSVRASDVCQPCQNGATTVSHYTCSCLEGYSGEHCEYGGWELVLYTSDVSYAGTDSDIDVRLGNENRQEEKFIVIDNENVNDRERSSVDKYTFTSSISNPAWLELQLKLRGTGPAWHLQKFILTNIGTGKVYEVKVNDWLTPTTEPSVRRFSLV